MTKMAFKLGIVAMAATLVLSTGCNKDDNNTPPPADTSKTIAEIASGDPNFSILVDALTRTNLVDAVNDKNARLTVFAPTNAAFADLLNDLGLADLDAVENAIGTEGLKNILLYHVLGTEVPSSAVSTGYAATLGTVNNNPLSLFINTQSGVRINDRANVTTADVEANNGVIHVIDKVILPLSLYDLISVNPDYSNLATAIDVADGDLDDLFEDETSGPFTVFAPTNAAFASALAELQLADLTALVTALGTDGVAEVLTYHAVSGNIRSDMVTAGMVQTVNGENITISLAGGVSITDANGRVSNVVKVDIQGTNGVIHEINKVLLP